jgi:adenine-specific DNA glycosylase
LRRFAAFVIQHRRRFLVRQRPASVLNAHLWEFPNVELFRNHSDLHAANRSLLGADLDVVTRLCTIRHSITRFRITLEAYRAKVAAPRTAATGQWFTLRQLHRLAFTSAHKKILARLSG